MPQPAYNLADFAPRKATQRQIRLAPAKKKRRGLAAHTLKTVRTVAAVTLLLALVCSVIYSQTQLTELDAQIAVQQQALTEAQSEYTYYNNEMSMRTSMAAVEQYASSQLGLIKMDKSQMTYINTGTDNRIERTQSTIGKIWASTSTTAMSVMEYIAP